MAFIITRALPSRQFPRFKKALPDRQRLFYVLHALGWALWYTSFKFPFTTWV